MNQCLSFWTSLKSKTQLIQFTGRQKVTKKFTDQKKKSYKKYWKDGIELSINENIKSPQIYTLPQFRNMSEKNCGIY